MMSSKACFVQCLRGLQQRRSFYCKQLSLWNEAEAVHFGYILSAVFAKLPHRELTVLSPVGWRPTIKATAPLRASVAAIASNPPRKSPLALRKNPMISGPKYPPRFAKELITAIPAAAGRPAIREVAIAQKGPAMDSAQAIPSPMHATTIAVECP